MKGGYLGSAFILTRHNVRSIYSTYGIICNGAMFSACLLWPSATDTTIPQYIDETPRVQSARDIKPRI